MHKDPFTDFSKSNKNISKEIIKLSSIGSFCIKLHKRMKYYYILHKRINLILFLEIFSSLKLTYKNVYGNFSLKTLFNIFDEDNDGYLNEDELILVFSIIKSKLCHFDQELICEGFYKQSTIIKSEIEKLTEIIYQFQTFLRQELYSKQLKQFKSVKSNK